MSTLDLHLLGGFQVVLRGRPVEGFESQNVRALLAYLACHADRPLAREQLAGLLWPEADQEAARRNLRQAIYNLRQTLGHDETGGWEPVLATHQTLRFNPEIDWWLDVRAFDDAVRKGLGRSDVLGTHELTRASEVYRGDFLIGFFVKGGGDAFEDWLIGEQERLREAAIQTLKSLVERFAARGEYRRAIAYARRLVEMDPLSEGSHRDLMRLYALSGRRGRALAQYEELENLLERELGVGPLEETRELHQAILTDDLPEDRVREAAQAVGPFVPLVGRGEAIQELTDSLEGALRDGARLALIEGEAGIGKTRLIRSFLNQTAAQRKILVLQGRCYSSTPRRGFEPLAEALLSAIAEDLDDDAPGDPAARQVTARLAAFLASARGEPAASPAALAGRADELCELAARFLANLCAPREAGGPARPLILFLDDLHLTTRSTAELTERLLSSLAKLPVWVVGACAGDALPEDHPLRIEATSATSAFDVIELERLDDDEVGEIADALVGDDGGDRLAPFLIHHGGGLPLRIVELVNDLADEGILVPVSDRDWGIAGEWNLAEVAVPGTLDELIMRRVGRLPTSARRQITLAAVIGQKFDADLLRTADNEHLGVVEIAIELVLERWLIRQFPRSWSAVPPERDLVLWAHGARRGTFEFAHPQIREAVYQSINPIRRQHIHLQVAEAIRNLSGEAPACGGIEAMAHHYVLAGEWKKGIEPLRLAAANAAALGDREVALFYLDRARAAARRLEGAAPTESGRERWSEAREEIEEQWEALGGDADADAR